MQLRLRHGLHHRSRIRRPRGLHRRRRAQLHRDQHRLRNPKRLPFDHDGLRKRQQAPAERSAAKYSSDCVSLSSALRLQNYNEGS